MPPPEGGKVSPIRSEYAVTARSGRTSVWNPKTAVTVWLSSLGENTCDWWSLFKLTENLCDDSFHSARSLQDW